MAQEPGNKRTTPTWTAIAIGLAVFIVGALAFYVIPGLMTGSPNTGDRSLVAPRQQEAYNKFDPARQHELKFPNGVLVPQGAPVSLNKDALAPVAVSEEGIIIYSTPAGGGGGQVARQNKAMQTHSRILPQALGKLYVQLPDGRFQPLVERKPVK
jgi:hypothetical protein